MTLRELEQCIETYGAEIYSFCVYLTGNRPEAEELYQDTFLKAMEVLDRIQEEGNPKSYLLSIAIRLWKNGNRKMFRRNRIAPTKSTEETPVETAVPGAAEYSEVEEGLLRREEIRQVQYRRSCADSRTNTGFRYACITVRNCRWRRSQDAFGSLRER